MEVRFSQHARDAIQEAYDNPTLKNLADHLEEMLNLLDTNPDDVRLRRHRMQRPKYWLVRVYGSDSEISFFWEERNGVIWVHWAGTF